MNETLENKILDNNKRLIYIIFVIFLGIFYRLIPHVPNFSPLYSISVFSSILPIELSNKFNKLIKYISFFIPLIILFITDLILGFYKGMVFNYLAFLSYSIFSYFIFNKYSKLSKTILGLVLSVVSSIYFFIISNFGVWLLTNMYSKDLAGFILCYINALPFLKNSIISSIIFSILIFYSYELLFLKGKDVRDVELN
jgi:hypothetical protein